MEDVTCSMYEERRGEEREDGGGDEHGDGRSMEMEGV